MATDPPAQNYDNHRKFVRAFHKVALPILLINLIFSAYVAVTSLSVESVIALLVAFALIIVAIYARMFEAQARKTPDALAVIYPEPLRAAGYASVGSPVA